ncbi:MAG: hypothetical protein EPO07_11580 [Verrucomicrobia bacterium]|nr:MAG: hypothetical protein EPO07_11580 [Verrucomicrobiota bacterium]
MVFIFSLTLFASALLLFWVQPMVAKMLLPLLGGTPTVWNTCMVFFQAMLLAGYGYAHWLTTRLPVKWQARLHVALLLATLAALPIGLSTKAMQSAPWNSNPFVWLLGTLLVLVALPFFTVSASGPLLQSWFSRTRHSSARDPYFLYAASNVGSLLGLLGYPVLVEPSFRLAEQTRLWTGIYGLLVVLFIACAALVWRTQSVGAATPGETTASATPAENAGPLTWRRRWRWILWAFIPSSLMLGVTTYLTTDIASVPLLWVIPLGIYLLTFILVFSQQRWLRPAWLVRAVPIAAVALVFMMLTDTTDPAWLVIVLHLVFFFLAAMAVHGRLADDRPASAQLTEFYFCMSVGGVLGGIFNALLSPVIFNRVAEYPLVIVLACLVAPAIGVSSAKASPVWRSATMALGVGALTAMLAVLLRHGGLEQRLRVTIVFGVPVVLCYFLSKQSWRFALALGCVMLASRFDTAVHGHTLRAGRNFFGSLRITLDPEGRFYRLYHGTTVHGIQSVTPELRDEPLSYYYRSGACGQVMEMIGSNSAARNIAVIGLGAGTMVAYAQPRQHWSFYEIDPAVIEYAQDTNYFTYLQRNTNATVTFKLGDARLRLREAEPAAYDLLVCDAFGSDVPPLHLLNREAMELYLSKLSPDGVLLFHISGRYLDFRPVIGNLAAHFHLTALSRLNATTQNEYLRKGMFNSQWVALARRPEQLSALATDARWQPLPPKPDMRLWTDDYSNILGIFEWR